MIRTLTRARRLAVAAALLSVPLLAVAGVVGVAAAQAAPSPLANQWPVAGADLSNTRNQPNEHILGPGNVGGLSVKWSFPTAAGSGVWATPTVAGGVVYAPDSAGFLYAVDARTGHQLWADHLPDLSPQLAGNTFARTSPVVFGGELILGDQHPTNALGTGAHLFAVDRATGRLRWITTVDPHPAAFITSSPAAFGGRVYAGVSSGEETLATLPSYVCCTFRGSVVSLDADTGQLLWQHFTVPDNHGQPDQYSGNAVWGSSPVIDPRRGLLYIGTGNNYTVPAGVCVEPDQQNCTQPAAADELDSILALDLNSGALRWIDRMENSDVFTIANRGEGPDFDFGSAPNLYTTTINGHRRDVLGIGQKSGVYWAVDPSTGHTMWGTQVGPGGTLGGIEWGSATDGNRVYVAVGNNGHVPYTLKGNGPFAGQTVTGGSFSAIDAATGKILWQTPDPQGALDLGFVTIANGVAYFGSDAGSGNNMYALDASTGKILWSFASGGSVASGAAVVNGVVYWGSGYHIGTEHNALYAFSTS
jgi:polyvinyl alcohol dehydrogenase (cytochrome)